MALQLVITGISTLWSLERHETYDGDLLVLLMPNDGMRESFGVSRSVKGYHLRTNLGDEFHDVGCFASFDELLGVVKSRAVRPQGLLK